MQRPFSDRPAQSNAVLSALLLLTGAICILFSSPKWLWPVAPWIGPACFLYYVQYTTVLKKWLWLALAIMPASALALLDVMPFPWFVMLLVVLFNGFKVILLYRLHQWLTRYRTGFGWTLVFPALWTVREFWETQGDIGTFASIATTQYPFPWLVQVVSVTGLWGITFLLYWFASVVVWTVRAYVEQRSFLPGVAIYALVLAGVLGFGAYRYAHNEVASAKSLTVGGVTVSNLPVLEALYQDQTGKTIRIDPTSSPASFQLQEANRGLVGFIENPGPARFRRGLMAIQQQQDSLFRMSEEAVARGAGLVMWSEGSALLPKSHEPGLLRRGQAFAVQNRAYLLMAIGAILPGKLTPERLFLENKTVLIDPAGRIVNVFYKNHPVPMAERSKPGDGTIPAIQTPYGTIAPSICYDADHINTMRQLGKQRIGLLLLPSGDWHGIAPYHSYMAVFRAVENGCSLARQVSGGLSVFTDYRGKVLADNDYFARGDKLTLVKLPVANVPTLYTRFGDWLAWLCVGLLVVFSTWAVWERLRQQRVARPTEAETTAHRSDPV